MNLSEQEKKKFLTEGLLKLKNSNQNSVARCTLKTEKYNQLVVIEYDIEFKEYAFECSLPNNYRDMNHFESLLPLNRAVYVLLRLGIDYERGFRYQNSETDIPELLELAALWRNLELPELEEHKMKDMTINNALKVLDTIDCDSDKELEQAIKTVKKYIETYEDADLIESQPTANEWITVERELPKHDKKVLITDADGEVHLAKRNAYREIWDTGYFVYEYEDVIAWKPTEPYTVDSNSKIK